MENTMKNKKNESGAGDRVFCPFSRAVQALQALAFVPLFINASI
jgi:hypothetical protein